ncbi:MAG: ThuA domain-containing protein, partial [Actinobacteria bacterium]|nr:ThuA domain-containing protein [Actinomycetota bacterium]
MKVDSALIVAGGSHAHDFPATAQALAGVLRDHGLAVDIVDEPDDAWAAMLERPEPYGMLAVNGLRFGMTHPRYDALRDRWAYRTPPAADAALDRHLAAGSSVFSVHTGCICFDDWDRWSRVLGRQWSWDEQRLSWHPELAPI